MIAPRHEIARLQSDFYRIQFHKMLRWLMGCLIIMYCLIAAIIYVVLVQPSISFYANTESGKIMPMPKAEY